MQLQHDLTIVIFTVTTQHPHGMSSYLLNKKNVNKSQIIVTEGGNFIINIFFHIFAVLSYQDNSIAVTIDTFE